MTHQTQCPGGNSGDHWRRKNESQACTHCKRVFQANELVHGTNGVFGVSVIPTHVTPQSN